MNPNIQKIREKVIAANPKKEWIFTCEAYPDEMHRCGEQYNIPIRLADVLFAIEERLSKAGVITKEPYHTSFAPICERWNFRADDLELQSPETIQFIADLLT